MIEKLNGRLFLADDVASATGVAGQALTNMLTRSGLSLVSDPPGRGKARLFPLIDVYQIGLTGKLTRASGSLQWAAEAANYLLHGIGGDPLAYGPDDAAEMMRIAGALRGKTVSDEEWLSLKSDYSSKMSEIAKDVRCAPREYWCRNVELPSFLVAELAYADAAGFANSNFQSPVVTDRPIGVGSGIFGCGIVVNLTSTFSVIDKVLASRIRAESR